MTNEQRDDANIKRILDKVQKLKAHAESAESIGNEAEAQAFATLYQRLLLQHNLSLSDIEFNALDTEDPIERQADFDPRKYDMKVTTSQPWLVRLANLVMKAHNCRHVRYSGTNKFYIVGRKADAQVAEWMYVTLVKACERIAKQETATYRWQAYKRDGSTAAAKGFKKAFVHGFITRLAQRLEETERSTVAESGEMGLVRVNKMQQKMDEFFAQFSRDEKLRTTRSMARPSMHSDGYKRGIAAANKVNLGQKPIEQGGLRKQLV